MIQSTLLLAYLFSLSPSALAAPMMMERRLWAEQKTGEIDEDQCGEKMKQWRCVFPQKPDCLKAMKDVGGYCRGQVVPDLPEYIDSDSSLATAKKVYLECVATEFSKRYILPLPKDKMDVYNECTGVTPRSKPLSVGFQKAMEYSKTQTTYSCLADGYLRKCFGYSEADCNSLVSKAQLDCTMRFEGEGQKVKDEQNAIEGAGRKITDCALADARKTASSTRKKSSGKDCN